MKTGNHTIWNYPLYFAFAGLFSTQILAAEEQTIIEHNQLMSHGDGHLMDMDGGMVMGQNSETLPSGCEKISEDVHIEVHAGRKFSKNYPGTVFGFNNHEWKVKPCTRLNVTFINEDNVRHQWMMHGLPKYIYDKGMFHLEITGPAKIDGTLILPAEDKTYLVHCDIAQHMEKGMKGQLIVGKGSGTFPSIPGITDLAVADNYADIKQEPAKDQKPLTEAGAAADSKERPAQQANLTTPRLSEAQQNSSSVFLTILGLVVGFALAPFLGNEIKIRFANMNLNQYADKAMEAIFELVRFLFSLLASFVSNLNKTIKALEKK